MPAPSVERALQLIDELELSREMSPEDVERSVHAILTVAGYAVSAPSPRAPDMGIDMELQGLIDGKAERVGIEVKSHRGTVSGQTIYKAMNARRDAGLDVTP